MEEGNNTRIGSSTTNVVVNEYLVKAKVLLLTPGGDERPPVLLSRLKTIEIKRL